MARSYNSVGAGETPKLGVSYFIEGEAHDGGNQTFSSVVVSTDIPKVARPGGAQGGGMQAAGSPLPAARPGGAQGIVETNPKGRRGLEPAGS